MENRTRDAHEIYKLAEVYKDVAFVMTNRLIQNFNDIDYDTKTVLAIPIVTNTAFSIELYLKCLFCLRHGYTKRGHDLEDLFEKLPEDYRIKIERYYDEFSATNSQTQLHLVNSGKLKMDLRENLHLSKLAFVHFRYQYEMKPEQINFSLNEFHYAIIKLVHEIKPEWLQLQSPQAMSFYPHPAFIKR